MKDCIRDHTNIQSHYIKLLAEPAGTEHPHRNNTRSNRLTLVLVMLHNFYTHNNIDNNLLAFLLLYFYYILDNLR